MLIQDRSLLWVDTVILFEYGVHMPDIRVILIKKKNSPIFVL